jgi:hypothetical protein
VFATLFFIAFACFRGLAFGTMACFAAGTAAGLFFSNFTLLGFTHARVGERMGAGTPLFFGQCAEHDA